MPKTTGIRPLFTAPKLLLLSDMNSLPTKPLFFGVIALFSFLSAACNSTRPVCTLDGSSIEVVQDDRVVQTISSSDRLPVGQGSDGGCFIAGQGQDNRLLAERLIASGQIVDSLDDLGNDTVEDLRGLISSPDFDSLSDDELLALARDCDSGAAFGAICSDLLVYIESLE